MKDKLVRPEKPPHPAKPILISCEVKISRAEGGSKGSHQAQVSKS